MKIFYKTEYSTDFSFGFAFNRIQIHKINKSFYLGSLLFRFWNIHNYLIQLLSITTYLFDKSSLYTFLDIFSTNVTTTQVYFKYQAP